MLEPCVPWLTSCLQTHAAVEGVAQHCLFLLRRVVWAMDKKAPLLTVVPLITVALRNHHGAPLVVEHGLAILRLLAYEDGNEVGTLGRPRWKEAAGVLACVCVCV